MTNAQKTSHKGQGKEQKTTGKNEHPENDEGEIGLASKKPCNNATTSH